MAIVSTTGDAPLSERLPDSTVTQQLAGALTETNVGAVLSRAMTVQGKSLVIQLDTTAWDGTPVTRTLAFERIG